MSNETSGWVNVSSGASAGVKGAYVELIESTLFASTWMSFMNYCENTNSDSLFDLATGLAGAEVIIIDDQLYHFRNTSGGSGRGSTLSFPMTIPRGTRLSVRVRDEESGAQVHEHVLSTSDFIPPVVPSLTADSSGEKIVQSGPLNLNGDWIELIPSTTENRGWMVVSLFSEPVTREAQLEIGTGIAGSEISLQSGLAFKRSSASGSLAVTFSTYIYFPINVPQGTRIAARVKDDNNFLTNYTVGGFLT